MSIVSYLLILLADIFTENDIVNIPFTQIHSSVEGKKKVYFLKLLFEFRTQITTEKKNKEKKIDRRQLDDN